MLIRNYFNSRYFFITAVILIIGVSGWVIVTDKWEGERWRDSIQHDGKGYYAYLPAIFIYGDLQYGFEKEIAAKYNQTYYENAYCNIIDSKKLNKYYGGTALLLLPFFLLACLLSYFLGYDVDGYSYIFQCSVSVAAVFYLVLAVILLRKFLRHYFSEQTTVFTILFIYFGTNLFYYTLYESYMSHVYSFFAVSGFLLFAHKAIHQPAKKYYLLAALFFGIIVFIRPINGLVVLLLPFLAGNKLVFKNFFQSFIKNKSVFLLSNTVVFAFVFLQLLLYKLQAGSFIVYSYSNEGFNFLAPEIMNVLFSYRKGFFVYTPLAFIALFGFYKLFYKNKFQFYWLLFFMLLTTYIISSWWMWFYGGTFGMRPFIDFYPLFAFLLAALICNIASGATRAVVFVAICFTVLLNLVQTHQKDESILPYDRMTKQKFWTIFMETDIKWAGAFDNYNWHEGKPRKQIYEMHDLENPLDSFIISENTIGGGAVFSGKKSSKIGDGVHKSFTYSRVLNFLPDSGNWCIRINARVWMNSLESGAAMCIGVGDTNGVVYRWYSMPLVRQIRNEQVWSSITNIMSISREWRSTKDVLFIFTTTDDDVPVYIDDLEVKYQLY
jgi:hypothetical protein